MSIVLYYTLLIPTFVLLNENNGITDVKSKKFTNWGKNIVYTDNIKQSIEYVAHQIDSGCMANISLRIELDEIFISPISKTI